MLINILEDKFGSLPTQNLGSVTWTNIISEQLTLLNFLVLISGQIVKRPNLESVWIML